MGRYILTKIIASRDNIKSGYKNVSVVPMFFKKN